MAMPAQRYALRKNLLGQQKMADEIIEELWRIKDSIARDHAYSVDELVAHLQTKGLLPGQKVVDLHAMRNMQHHSLDCKPCLNT
jgi:hypothetical protein